MSEQLAEAQRRNMISEEVEALKRMADNHRMPTAGDVTDSHVLAICMGCDAIVRIGEKFYVEAHDDWRTEIRCTGSELQALLGGAKTCLACGEQCATNKYDGSLVHHEMYIGSGEACVGSWQLV